MNNPYEYEAQNQFIREAENVLEKFGFELSKFDGKFTREQRTNKKAIWMLQNEALDSLKDILYLLKEKKHRPAGRLFRDVLETLDFSSYFYSKTMESKENLKSWYDYNIIPHRIYRQHIKKTKSEELEKIKANYYSIISKFNHRTFKILLYSYIFGRDNLLVYDGYKDPDSLVLPSTLAMYLAILADLIRFFSEELTDKKLVPKTRINNIWESSCEKKPVKRKYLPLKFVFEKHFPQK